MLQHICAKLHFGFQWHPPWHQGLHPATLLLQTRQGGPGKKALQRRPRAEHASPWQRSLLRSSAAKPGAGCQNFEFPKDATPHLNHWKSLSQNVWQISLKEKTVSRQFRGPLIIPAREQATFRSDLLWLHSLSQSWHLPAAAVYLYSNTNYKRDNIKRSTQWTHVDRPCLMMSRWISDPRIHQESQQAKKAR